MRRLFAGFFSVLLFSTFFFFGIRSLRSASNHSQVAAATANAQATTDFGQKMAEIIAKSTEEYLSEDPEVLGYRADLLLERATDLILLYYQKINANELKLTDSESRRPYLDAFTVAVDYANQVNPPNYMAYPWHQVNKVESQYNQAYIALAQGRPLATADIYNLKNARQILTNYQDMAEKNLAQRELREDFLAYQQQWVDRYLQDKYGSMPVPVRQP